MSTRALLKSLAAVLIFTACGEKQTAPPPPPLSISAIQVSSKTVPIEKEFVGEVLGKSDIPIRARVDGYLEKEHFKEGRRVKKGQLLYTIDDQPFQQDVTTAQSQLAEAQVRAINAKSELDRYEPLIKIKAVSQSDYDAAKANKDAADEAVKAAEAALNLARINLGYCSIKSPIDGVIGKSEAEVGEYVGRAPNPVILNTVSQIDSVRVQFYLTESDYLKVAREMLKERESTHEEAEPPHESNLRLVLSDGSVFEGEGVVNFLNRNVDAGSGSLLVQASFENKNGLIRPGQFAKVRANMDVVEGAILIPQRAVLETQGRNAVYIVNSDSTVTRTTITLGPKYRDYYIVSYGLDEGAVVAIDGLQRLRDGARINFEVKEFNSQYPADE